jgi:hypothetical protein
MGLVKLHYRFRKARVQALLVLPVRVLTSPNRCELVRSHSRTEPGTGRGVWFHYIVTGPSVWSVKVGV